MDELREIVARIEKKHGIGIPQSTLSGTGTLKAAYDLVAEQAGWQD